MKALRLPAPLRSRLCLLGLVFALSAHATTYYVTISGLGGEPDYDQRFKMWTQDIDSSLKKAGGDSNVATLDAPTRDQVRARLNAIAKEAKPNDAFVLMLIGHGSYDGVDYKFNLPGPDLGGAELAALLDRIPATRQLVVNMTSASGGSIDFLRKPGRVLITATKSGIGKERHGIRPLLGRCPARPRRRCRQERDRLRPGSFSFRRAQDHRVLRHAEAPGHRALRIGRHR